MIIHNNCSVLAHQNCREIGHTLAPGYVTSVITDWGRVIDASPDTATGVFGSIPWHQDYNAVVVGPYVPAYTRVGTAPPGMWPREVRVVVDATKNNGGTDLTIMAVLVSGTSTPLSSPAVAQDSLVIGGGGGPAASHQVSLLLSPQRPLAPSTLWRSRPGDTLAASTPVEALYVWVGWYSTDTLDAVWSVSAFEVPE